MADAFPPAPTSPDGRAPGDRLDSWKEIAAYLKRDVTTVQRWEKREGMPVHRHLHEKLGSVYAYRAALDAWARTRRPADASPPAAQPPAEGTSLHALADLPPGETTATQGTLERESVVPSVPARARRQRAVWIVAGVGLTLAALAGWQLRRNAAEPSDPLQGARFVQLTDFDGIEQAAAISRDGRFAAFQSDREGPIDVWITQVGTGKFANLTRGAAKDIANPSLRTLGFSPDGSLVTFWSRGGGEGSQRGISVWAVPLLGGQPRPYLEGAAEYDWSSDGARLVFHTPGPGDPMYVRDAGEASDARNIFTAPEGLHGHFLAWSPEREFIYFVQGALPDRLDVWRIRPTGGAPERITHHDATVTHPVFLDARTLLYLATDADGFGPWIHAIDLDRRVSRRVSFGVDAYTSLAASADGERLVAARTIPKRTVWRVPFVGGRVDMSAARRVPLTAGNASFARLGPDFLLYVSTSGTRDTLWKVQGGTATDLWSAPDARIVGAPAIRRDGRRLAFTVRRGGRTALHVVNADGTDARAVTSGVELQGSPAWAPSGESVTVAAVVNGTPQLFDVPLDGGPPAPLVGGHSVDPAWTPGGDLVAFTGPDVGTTFPLRAANADGTPRPIAAQQLTRGARHLAFLPGGRSLLVLRGELRHKNLWVVDLDTGAERQVTDLGPEFELRDFDVSPDGREIVLEQVQDQSDLVLIERTTAR
jgi:Tol biopolymer transport system component